MKGEFYKMDFRAWNIGTVDLTLEQEAAYLRLCHAMYDVGGPVPNSARFLMGIFRCGNAKAAALVRQLIEAGKLAVTADGKLFNQRVSEELRDREEVSSTRRIAGQKGGLARREKTEWTPSDVRVTPECTPSDPRLHPECYPSDPRVDASNPLKTNEPDKALASKLLSRGEERRGEHSSETTSPRNAREDGFPPKAFAEFWVAYPHKVGKHAAETAFAKVRQRGSVSFADLMAGLDRYVKSKPLDRAWCNPATWLNQGRWTDEPCADQSSDRRGSGAANGGAGQRGGGDMFASALADVAARRGIALGGGNRDSGSAPPNDPNIVDAYWRDACRA
jgi:uncharacterized protein YdaU (DUF1376 family)